MSPATFLTATAWLTGLVFPEAPRWNAGRLWFSDMHGHAVFSVAEDGRPERFAEVPYRPSGLGFAPDGSVVVVSMLDRRLLRCSGRAVEEWSDLSDLAAHPCNDLVMDDQGRAYVGSYGYDAEADEEPRATDLLLVDVDGSATVAARGLGFPNGMAVVDDGQTLLVAETDAQRISAFSVTDDGLADRHVFADLPGRAPDGICADGHGGIWVADASRAVCLRVERGGRITDQVHTSQPCFACALGGLDGRTLYLTTAPTWRPAQAEALRAGAIERLDVAISVSGGAI